MASRQVAGQGADADRELRTLQAMAEEAGRRIFPKEGWLRTPNPNPFSSMLACKGNLSLLFFFSAFPTSQPSFFHSLLAFNPFKGIYHCWNCFPPPRFSFFRGLKQMKVFRVPHIFPERPRKLNVLMGCLNPMRAGFARGPGIGGALPLCAGNLNPAVRSASSGFGGVVCLKVLGESLGGPQPEAPLGRWQNGSQ